MLVTAKVDVDLQSGMNMVGGVLLLHMGVEEAFWLLVTIIESVLPGYYNKTLTGSIVDQRYE